MRVVFDGTLAIAVTCLVAQVSSIARTGALKNAIGMELMMQNQSAIVGDNNRVDNLTRAEVIAFANRLDMNNAAVGTKRTTYGPLDEIVWYEKRSNDESQTENHG